MTETPVLGADVNGAAFAISPASGPADTSVTAHSIDKCPVDATGAPGVEGGAVSLNAPAPVSASLTPGQSLAADGSWSVTLVVPASEPSGTYAVSAFCTLQTLSGAKGTTTYANQLFTVGAVQAAPPPGSAAQAGRLGPHVQADVTDSPSESRSYGVNHFRLLGRMTGDPQLRFTQSGKAGWMLSCRGHHSPRLDCGAQSMRETILAGEDASSG